MFENLFRSVIIKVFCFYLKPLYIRLDEISNSRPSKQINSFLLFLKKIRVNVLFINYHVKSMKKYYFRLKNYQFADQLSKDIFGSKEVWIIKLLSQLKVISHKNPNEKSKNRFKKHFNRCLFWRVSSNYP